MQHKCEVCIVGAGPAGLSIARELASKGIDVAVVESGGTNPTLNAQQSLAGKSAGYPYHRLDKALFSGVGGSAQLWWGHNRFRPLDVIDFEERRGIPDSGWPFGLGSLMPYYETAQAMLPLGPFDYTADFWEQETSPRFALPADEIETTIFQTTSGGASGAEAIAGLAANPNFRLMTETTVTELFVDESGHRIDRAQLRYEDGSQSVISADAFVLAAGAFDNTRLLLMSNKRWTKGLGNSNDLVGRFFMEHPAVSTAYWVPSDSALFGRSRLYSQHTVRGTPIIGTLTVSEEIKRREGLLNAAIFLSESDDLRTSDVYRSLAMISPKGLKNMRWTPSIYAENLVNIARHPIRATSTLLQVATGSKRQSKKVFDLRVVSEQSPNPESRLFLDSTVDEKGLPRMRLDWRFNDLDKWSMRRTQEILAEAVQKAGMGTVEHFYGDEQPEARIYGQRHQMGTTRMHEDPRRGVVDADSRVHDVHNLYVTGSSVFPTGGHANTTLTIMALALRLADHLADVFEERRGIKPQ
jgi:choline dehydrogenase-like flavoprotein